MPPSAKSPAQRAKTDDSAKPRRVRGPKSAETKPADALKEVTTENWVTRLPDPARFALAAVASFTLCSAAYSFLSIWSKGELEAIAKPVQPKKDVAILATWRIVELSLGWYGNITGYELAALNVLSHGSFYFLSAVYYTVSPWTAGACLAIDTISAYVPLLLLRTPSNIESAPSDVPNREIVADSGIKASTTVLSALVYSISIFIALQSYLQTAFVIHFEGIPRVIPALDTLPAKLFVVSLAFLTGAAARSLIFVPFATTGKTVEDTEIDKFDPVEATLAETLKWNLWGFTTRTKVAIVRTLGVMIVTWVNTFLQCTLRIKGVEPYGAALYATAWAMPALLTGLALDLVGDA
ncbi:hypothetical protein VTK73DRAFT_957 [Phialemonium thermophilum]|uniref:Uncharacterized protein n=1 Tax=Phialemonium thermophilum TaxID=223376 RepID=A0ABR3XBZ5_9PEZI